MSLFSDSVDVVVSAAGVPLELDWGGRRYTVAEEPVCWYERRNWWNEESRAPRGAGVGLVDRQMWRVQVHDDDSVELLTFDLVRYRPANRWRIIKIHDALTESSEPVIDD